MWTHQGQGYERGGGVSITAAACAFLVEGQAGHVRDIAVIIRRGTLLPAVTLAILLSACGGGAPGERAASPTATQPALETARRAAAAGDWAGAERLLVAAVKAEPGSEEAWVALANLRARSGRIAEAADDFARLADLRPANGVYARQAGSFLEASRRSEQAGPYLERAFRLRPEDPDAAYRYGLHLFFAGHNEDAVAALTRGMELAPRRPDVALKLAQALARLGRFDGALAVLDEALGRLPDEPLLNFQRGLVQARDGHHQAAAVDFRRVLQLDPGLHRARYALARALLAAGERQEGAAMMAEFAAGEEERRQRQTARLVQHLARAGGGDDPLEHRRRLQDLVLADPRNSEAHRLLAEAYAEEGDYQQAAAAYARALHLDPADRRSALRRGEMLRRLGRAGEEAGR